VLAKEDNQLMREYLLKTEEKLVKLKNEAYAQMRRKAKFVDIQSEEFKAQAVRLQIQDI